MPLLVLAYLAYISMALPDGLFGVAWPSMRLTLGAPVSAVGLLLPFGVASSLLSSTVTGFVVDRAGMGRLLAMGTALSAAALAIFGLAPAFWVLIPAIMLLAAGSGGVDAALNVYAARRFTARHINWMHASYGLGAMAGPLVVTAIIDSGLSWRWAYTSIAAVQAVVSVAFLATARRWAIPPPRRRPPSSHVWHALRVSGLWRGAAVFAVETGFESTTALWTFLFLTSGRGLSHVVAGATVSAYWATLCLGRLVLGPLAEQYGPHRVLRSAIAAMVLGAVLVLLPTAGAVAIAGVVVIALGAAPMFPLLTLTTRERVGAEHADQTVGVQVAASVVGSASIPALVGVLIGHFSTAIMGPCLLVLAVAVAIAYTAARRAGTGTPPAQDAATRPDRRARGRCAGPSRGVRCRRVP
jgi:fucose permease